MSTILYKSTGETFGLRTGDFWLEQDRTGDYNFYWDGSLFLSLTKSGKFKRYLVHLIPGLTQNKNGAIKKAKRDFPVLRLVARNSKISRLLMKINKNDILIRINNTDNYIEFAVDPLVASGLPSYLFCIVKDGTLYREKGIDPSSPFSLDQKGRIAWSD